ncbi:hypothetical protein FGO68_gene16684 [Halteria grandinella]|uniref:Uncharacterized protein n=1 Tax=Halteria grandinella TaxID=5974 RepID=A0A8J8SYC2_HALGN|nr:hypothetical protein FGO68_gene16684 [Halteria grandinella]
MQNFTLPPSLLSNTSHSTHDYPQDTMNFVSLTLILSIAVPSLVFLFTLILSLMLCCEKLKNKRHVSQEPKIHPEQFTEHALMTERETVSNFGMEGFSRTMPYGQGMVRLKRKVSDFISERE